MTNCSAIHPGLIMCSISLAGQTGPLSAKPGFDYMGAAYAGVTALIGEADRGPAQFTTAIGDSSTGVAAAMAIGFALLHRERTGEGQYIECSLARHLFPHARGERAERVRCAGRSFAPKRAGSLHPDGGPTGVFRYRDDEFIAIMVMPYQWPQMIKAHGHAGAGGRSALQHAAGAARQQRGAQGRSSSEWLGGFPSRDAALRRWKRSVCPARRCSPCTRPWRIRICASAEPCGGSRTG